MSEAAGSFNLTVEQVHDYEFRVSFDKPYAELRTDEPAPLGQDVGPNPARLLAASIANCLSASLLFCLSKKGQKIQGLKTNVHVELVRNERNRLRIGRIDVHLAAPVDRDSAALMACLDGFEDFCVVTQSVREGLDVKVNVEAIGSQQ